MRIEEGILFSDYDGRRYPLSEFMVGEIEYHDKSNERTGWTFQIMPISDMIKKFYPELEEMIRHVGYFYLMPSQDEEHARAIHAEILAYGKTAKNGEYWIVDIGEGEYQTKGIAYFDGGKWYKITHGEYAPECGVIDDKVTLINCIW